MGVQIRTGLVPGRSILNANEQIFDRCPRRSGKAPHWANIEEGAWETAGPQEMSKSLEDRGSSVARRAQHEQGGKTWNIRHTRVSSLSEDKLISGSLAYLCEREVCSS